MKYRSVFAILCIFGISAIIGAEVIPAFAQSADEIRSQIEQTNNEISELEEEIAQFQEELNEVQNEKSTLAREVKRLDLTRRKLAADISLTEKKISVQRNKIIELTESIGDKDEAISVERTSMASSLRRVQKFDDQSTIELLLSEESLSDFWTEVSTLERFYRQLASHTQELKTLRRDLSASKTAVEQEKEELEALQGQLAAQKRAADNTRAEKNRLLAATENKESQYQALLAEKQKQKEELEQAIFDYESQLEFILDPDKLPEARHALFSWPLDEIYITQLFGKTVAAKRLYADGSHSGVDFRASIGTPVKSVADATVAGVGNTDDKMRVTWAEVNVRARPNGSILGRQNRGALGTIVGGPQRAGGYSWWNVNFKRGVDGWVAGVAFETCVSYGKWVLLDHGNGLGTIYAHLSDITAREGQRVNRGGVIAYSGNTGNSTGPHLHLGVVVADAVEIVRLGDVIDRASNCTDARIPVTPKDAYLDPMEYLPEYNQ